MSKTSWRLPNSDRSRKARDFELSYDHNFSSCRGHICDASRMPDALRSRQEAQVDQEVRTGFAACRDYLNYNKSHKHGWIRPFYQAMLSSGGCQLCSTCTCYPPTSARRQCWCGYPRRALTMDDWAHVRMETHHVAEHPLQRLRRSSSFPVDRV